LKIDFYWEIIKQNKITFQDFTILQLKLYYLSIRSKTLFSLYDIFHFCKFKVFSNSLSFFPCKCKSFQTGSFHCRFTLPTVLVSLSSKRSNIFIDPFLYLLLYSKPLVSNINIQFSIESFLDWEGHHRDSCLSHSSCHRSKFPTSVNAFQHTLLANIYIFIAAQWPFWL